MPEPDEFDDPSLTLPPDQAPTFWKSIHWRLRLGVLVVILTGITFFFGSLFNARSFVEIPAITIGSMVGVAGLWVFSRVLWAWVEWPSSSIVLRGIKGVIRFLLFDAESERRATETPTDQDESID
jgi:cytochrome b subunit of formate dehydrogenase